VTSHADVGKTWKTAAVSAGALMLTWNLRGHLVTGAAPKISQHASGMISLLVLPFVFSLPVAWVSNDPGLAGGAFIACAGIISLIWSVVIGAGEDLGPILSTLIASALIIPGAVLGVGSVSLFKAMRPSGISLPRPTRTGYFLLAFMIFPPLIASRYSTHLHPRVGQESIRPVSVTETALQSAANTVPTVSDTDKLGSRQHYLTGVIQFQKKNFNSAVREWAKAVSLDPGNADAHAALARLASDKGQP
jgi:hypothetical protein